jgi:hypothetical protein
MPRVARTIIPRIQRSLRERGLATTLRRSLLLPLHLLREYLNARALRPNPDRNDFDQKHGVDTGGAFDGWVYLSDLDIPSPNWIDGNDYLGIDPERFEVVLSSLGIALDDFTFIDFGSGKGRALMLASEHPFKRIIGLEFSPELHRIAEENIPRYISPTQKCRDVRSLNVDLQIMCFPQMHWCCFFSVHVVFGFCPKSWPRSDALCSYIPVRSSSRTWPPRQSRRNYSHPPVIWREYS